MPVNPNHEEINAAAQRDDPDSVFHHYRRLIELRHRLPAVVDGDFEMLLANDEQVYAFTRPLGDDHLLVLGNFSGEAVRIELPGGGRWCTAETVITNVGRPCSVEPSGAIELQPWEATVLRHTGPSA